jgi:integrase
MSLSVNVQLCRQRVSGPRLDGTTLDRQGMGCCIGLDQSRYGTHSLRRTKATLICKRTKNIRAIQLLLGHTKLESTVRYLGIEVDDALEISEQTEI